MNVLVRDRKTQEPIPMSKVVLTGECDAATQNGESDSKGISCYTVKCECNYIAVANANGYLPGSGSGTTIGKCEQLVKCGDAGGETIIVELDKLPAPGDQYANQEGQSGFFELKDIYYDFDKWNIRSESDPQLKILLGFLVENPDAIVEIASHTDARAPSDYNIRLSQKRAQSVVDWLVSHGIDRSRLKPKGYGETTLRNNCADDVKCSEYEHQRNRRTEFRVISGSIDIKSLERMDMQVDPCRVCPF
jgi:outer membrane protein OmpA-like peptidoglycan-associated protein